MRNIVFSIALLCFSSANARPVECGDILMADGGYIENQSVSYIISRKTPCVVIRLKIPGGKGEYRSQEEICYLDGRSLEHDFQKVEFRRGEFIGGDLVFEVYVALDNKEMFYRKVCRLLFSEGRPDKLVC